MHIPSSHESMLLVGEPLDLVLDLDSLLPLLDIVLVLTLGREHNVWDGDTGRIVGVDHSWVNGSRSLEVRVLLGREVHNLASPAEAYNSPLLDAAVVALDLFQDLGDTLKGLGRCCGRLEEVADELLLLFL